MGAASRPLRMLRGGVEEDVTDATEDEPASWYFLENEVWVTDWVILALLLIAFAVRLYMVAFARKRYLESQKQLEIDAANMPRIDFEEVRNNEACMVCLENFAQPGFGLQVRATSPLCPFVLPCNHAAHRQCVEMWFEQQERFELQPSCPYCRFEVSGLHECGIARVRSSQPRPLRSDPETPKPAEPEASDTASTVPSEAPSAEGAVGALPNAVDDEKPESSDTASTATSESGRRVSVISLGA